jgi:hypothetical protein
VSKRWNVIFHGDCFNLITWVDDFDGTKAQVVMKANEMLKQQTGWDVFLKSEDVEVEMES